jgi:hypothetical protein
MKQLWLLVAVTAALAVPAAADSTLYTNGPIEAQNAWYISDSLAVADSFTLSASSTLTSVEFGAWNQTSIPGVLEWAITTGTPFTASSTMLFSGIAHVSVIANFGDIGLGEFDVTSDTFSLPSGIDLASGTYYLTLQNGVADGVYPIAWDESDGPSTAYSSQSGLLSGKGCQIGEPASATCSESFTIYGSSATVAPEPGSISLLLSGIVGLTLLAVRKCLR